MRDTRQGLGHAPRKLIPPHAEKWLKVADSGCEATNALVASFSAYDAAVCACPRRAGPQCFYECLLEREYYPALRTIARSSPRRSCESLATVASCAADASSNPTLSPRGA